jgi:hypothetical protein
MPFTLNYVSYEGIRYIASLERMDTPAAVPTKAKRVYVAGDHCGMTNFIVSSSDMLPVVDEVPNVLWKTYEIQEGRHQSFYLRGDVSACVFISRYQLLPALWSFICIWLRRYIPYRATSCAVSRTK